MLSFYNLLRLVVSCVFIVFLLQTQAHAARDGSTDRPGLDYKTLELSTPNPDLCEAACKKDGQCRAWSYSWPGAKGPKAMCALKTGVPPKRSDTCCISGIKSASDPVTKPEEPKAATKPKETTEDTDNAAAKVEPEKQEPAKKKKAEKKKQKQEEKKTAALPAPDEDEAISDDGRDVETVTPRVKPEPPAKKEKPKPDPQKVAACEAYASRAMAQNAENERLACGLSGSRWGFGRKAYFNYCMRSPSSAYNGARAARDRELQSCRRAVASRTVEREQPREDDDSFLPNLPDLPRIPDVDLGGIFDNRQRTARFCRSFASQSIRQVRQARQLRCGYSGRRWSGSRVQQARLCRQIGPDAAADLLEFRADALASCRRSASRVPSGGASHNRCTAYARSAVNQARESRQLGCGFGGPRWSRSYNAHYRWCRTASRRETNREYRRRERLLDRCE